MNPRPRAPGLYSATELHLWLFVLFSFKTGVLLSGPRLALNGGSSCLNLLNWLGSQVWTSLLSGVLVCFGLKEVSQKGWEVGWGGVAGEGPVNIPPPLSAGWLGCKCHPLLVGLCVVLRGFSHLMGVYFFLRADVTTIKEPANGWTAGVYAELARLWLCGLFPGLTRSVDSMFLGQ